MTLTAQSPKKIYIRVDNTTTETKTYSWFSDSSTDWTIVYNDIAKSGNKIKEITFEWSCSANDFMSLVYLSVSKTNNFDNARWIAFNIGRDNTSSYSWLRVRQSGSNMSWGSYQIPSSSIIYTGTNTFSVTFDEEYNYSLTINGHSYSGTYTDNSVKTQIDGIFSSSTVKFRAWVMRSTLSTQTVTITYEEV